MHQHNKSFFSILYEYKKEDEVCKNGENMRQKEKENVVEKGLKGLKESGLRKLKKI